MPKGLYLQEKMTFFMCKREPHVSGLGARESDWQEASWNWEEVLQGAPISHQHAKRLLD